jgi:hypothetical protein
MSDKPTANLPQWDDYLQTLGGAKSLLDLLPDPNDAALRQDVYRLLMLGLSQGYLTTFVDANSPDFTPTVNSILSASSANPDFVYYQASITGAGEYLITGYRGSALFVHMDVAAGGLGVMDELGTSTDSFMLDDLDIAANGYFELLLSATKPASFTGNWRPLDPKAKALVIRQAAYDWGAGNEARLAIERIDIPVTPPVFDAQETSHRLQRLAAQPQRYAALWLKFMAGQRQKELYNRLELGNWGGLGGVDGQFYYQGLYRLQPGEALIIETDLPESCLYWNVQVSDRLWNSIDWVNRQSSLNGAQARLDSDGRFRAVIAQQDPGVPNWLDSGPHSEGAIMLRWTKASSGPEPRLRVVKLAELRQQLPADTPQVTSEQREKSLRQRRRDAQMRRRW